MIYFLLKTSRVVLTSTLQVERLFNNKFTKSEDGCKIEREGGLSMANIKPKITDKAANVYPNTVA